jgi:LPXTG-motif cell wall-anchored protein
MATDVTPATLDAVMRSRRIARHAELLEEAKGKENWISVLGGLLLLGLLWFSYRRSSGGFEMGTAVFFAFCIASWVEGRISRRLTAIVKLLEEQSSSGTL